MFEQSFKSIKLLMQTSFLPAPPTPTNWSIITINKQTKKKKKEKEEKRKKKKKEENKLIKLLIMRLHPLFSFYFPSSLSLLFLFSRRLIQTKTLTARKKRSTNLLVICVVIITRKPLFLHSCFTT